ncbi:hypothetical protein [Neptunicella sp. SCSIO 80796]|uniref:hypothetical protein n=1 Tax=Neptunicella plasticusilytica TaxID=3117012 RepID=UPI003A4D84E9
MNKYWLNYVLLLMIAVQSMFAVASQQQPHQIDINHLKVEHSHQSDKLSVLKERGDALSAGHNIEDCHHCGHCHGSHSVSWVNSVFRFSLDDREQNKLLDVEPAYLPTFTDNLLRPPIFA